MNDQWEQRQMNLFGAMPHLIVNCSVIILTPKHAHSRLAMLTSLVAGALESRSKFDRDFRSRGVQFTRNEITFHWNEWEEDRLTCLYAVRRRPIQKTVCTRNQIKIQRNILKWNRNTVVLLFSFFNNCTFKELYLSRGSVKSLTSKWPQDDPTEPVMNDRVVGT